MTLCLQETWLAKQQEEELKTMRKAYSAVSNSPNGDSLCIITGRKGEGLATLWNNKCGKFITTYKYGYDWVVSIEIATKTKKMYTFNSYLPYDNKEEYLLTKLHNLL